MSSLQVSLDGEEEFTWSPVISSCQMNLSFLTFSSDQSFSHVRLFVAPWTAARQASLPITNSLSLLKLMSIESVMPSNHLILCCLFLLLPSIFLSIRVFSMSRFFASGGPSIIEILWHSPVMTNLDSILKSRDITLPTKVRLVKAMVFPVVTYGCESWTVKKAEHRRIDAFEL